MQSEYSHITMKFRLWISPGSTSSSPLVPTSLVDCQSAPNAPRQCRDARTRNEPRLDQTVIGKRIPRGLDHDSNKQIVRGYLFPEQISVLADAVEVMKQQEGRPQALPRYQLKMRIFYPSRENRGPWAILFS